MKRTSPGLYALAIVGALALASPGQAQPSQDAQLKAAFVYRFAQLTQWPPPPLSEFIYCVAGSGSMQGAMQALPAKGLGGLQARLQVVSEPAQARRYQLLMLGFTAWADLLRWQTALQDEPLLVVSDNAEAFRVGAIIGRLQEPDGLAFRINLSEAKRRGPRAEPANAQAGA
ncbi:MAG: YfiR family protein [Ideonella sp.]|nr:YfiR family protein [Ideonella sp.]